MSTRKRSDADFDREIRAHLELEVDRLVERGMDPDAARDAARRTFGNVAVVRERFYESGRLLWLDHLWQDVKCAARNLRRAPVAATVAIASLAAGIGATTVTLTVRDIVFHSAPPLYRDPASMSRVQVGPTDVPIMPLGSAVPARLFVAWRERFGPAIGGSMGRGQRDVRSGDRVETAPVRAVTPGFFALLGVRAELGQADAPADREASPSAVLSDGIWRRVFDARPDVLGQVIWIDNEPHTVTGVLPQRFWFGDMGSPIWTTVDPRALPAADRLDTIVRRAAGDTPEILEAQLQPGLADYAARLPDAQRSLRLRVSGIEGTPVGHQVATILPYLLGASVLLTLLIACANAAILMIAQWTAREHEIAIRASIGASRGRIVRLLLTESVLVAGLGGALGAAFTYVLFVWVLSRGDDASFFDLSIDPIVFVQTAAIALFAGLAAGLAPSLYETRRLQVNPLRTIARSDRVRQRWRSALVVFEITVTVALLVETSAMIHGYLRAADAEMGYDTRPLMSARVENPSGVPTPQLLQAVAAVPGVASVAAATVVPQFTLGRRARVAADPSASEGVPAEHGQISPGFFSTLGVPMRAGRPFAAHDSDQVAIVNEALARRAFQGRDPIGSRIWIDRAARDVVGVVADYSSNAIRRGEFEPKVFVPLPRPSKELTRVYLLVRADGDPAPLTQTIRREVRDGRTGSAVTGAYTVEQILKVGQQEMLVGTAPLFPLIAIGMLMTTAGIYGVLAFAIARRSRELAVRVALGATGRDLVRLVSAQTIRLVGAGAAAGVAATLALSRVVRASGGAGSVWDPGPEAFLVPVVIVLVIGAIATWIPSRRARRINPADLLRSI